MRRPELESRFGHKVLWKVKLEVPFNALLCSEVFRRNQLSLISSGEDGKVRLYYLESLEAAVRHAVAAAPANAAAAPLDAKADLVLETKGGPVHAMVAHNVTRFYVKDLVCACSRGVMTVFCNEQIICRSRLSDRCLECAAVHEDRIGNVAIILSDADGNVFASTPYGLLWRVSLNEAHVPGVAPAVPAGPLGGSTVLQEVGSLGLRVLCLATAELTTRPGGEACSYVLASDDCSRLFVLCDGSIVAVITTPGSVTAICSGYFIADDRSHQLTPAHQVGGGAKQLALATDRGSIYIMENFEVSSKEYAHVDQPISHMMTLSLTMPQRCSSGALSSQPRLDGIVCAGQFAGAHVLHCGKFVDYLDTSDWCAGLQLIMGTGRAPVSDLPQEPPLLRDAGDGCLAIVGCLDGTVHAFSCYMRQLAGISAPSDVAGCGDENT